VELYQLRYFLAVHRHGGVLSAARRLHVSPPALSKAVASLEEELGTPLFRREGRGLASTSAGVLFARRAREILELGESALREVGSATEAPALVLAGRELLLSEYGGPLVAAYRKRYPAAQVRFISCGGREAQALVEAGEAHVSLTVQKPPPSWWARRLGSLDFATCAGPGHPALGRARRAGGIPVEELLRHGFVSPAVPVLSGQLEWGSPDSWRDDVHPRRIDYVVESLYLYRELILSGGALAYAPRPWVRKIGAQVVAVSGCRFQARAEVFASTRNARSLEWLRRALAGAGP
jgi:DNA-binding transcriptional LysR family regulator